MRGLKALCSLVFMAICAAAFMDRGICRYLLGLNHFALIDFAEPVWHCVAEYLLIGALFVIIGSIAINTVQRFAKRKKQKMEPLPNDSHQLNTFGRCACLAAI